MTDVFDFVNDVTGGLTPTILLGVSGIALMILKRWRHFFTLMGGIIAIEFIGGHLYDTVARARPYGIEIIGDWGGAAFPSPPVG